MEKKYLSNRILEAIGMIVTENKRSKNICHEIKWAIVVGIRISCPLLNTHKNEKFNF